MLANTFVLLLIVTNVLDRLSGKDIGIPYTSWASLALVPVLAHVLSEAQQPINLVCDDPQGMSNDELTAANWAWILLGACLWVLILIGMTMTPA